MSVSDLPDRVDKHIDSYTANQPPDRKEYRSILGPAQTFTRLDATDPRVSRG
jgi:hypothetical protein